MSFPISPFDISCVILTSKNIIYKKWRKFENSERNFSPKTLVFNVILAFLDHLKPNIFFVGQPWAPSFQNIWIRPCCVYCFMSSWTCKDRNIWIRVKKWNRTKESQKILISAFVFFFLFFFFNYRQSFLWNGIGMETGHWAMLPPNFETFLIFSNFLRR